MTDSDVDLLVHIAKLVEEIQREIFKTKVRRALDAEAEKKRAADSDAALAMANSLYAESELHVIHKKAEIRHILADHDRVCEERDAALAEVARLREALESICRTIFVPERTEPGDLQKAVELTIAALASKETP